MIKTLSAPFREISLPFCFTWSILFLVKFFFFFFYFKAWVIYLKIFSSCFLSFFSTQLMPQVLKTFLKILKTIFYLFISKISLSNFFISFFCFIHFHFFFSNFFFFFFLLFSLSLSFFFKIFFWRVNFDLVNSVKPELT